MKLKPINDTVLMLDLTFQVLANSMLGTKIICTVFITFSFPLNLVKIPNFQFRNASVYLLVPARTGVYHCHSEIIFQVPGQSSLRNFRNSCLFKIQAFSGVFCFSNLRFFFFVVVDAANLHFNRKLLVLKLGLISVRFYYDLSPRYHKGFELARTLQ